MFISMRTTRTILTLATLDISCWIMGSRKILIGPWAMSRSHSDHPAQRKCIPTQKKPVPSNMIIILQPQRIINTCTSKLQKSFTALTTAQLGKPSLPATTSKDALKKCADWRLTDNLWSWRKDQNPKVSFLILRQRDRSEKSLRKSLNSWSK